MILNDIINFKIATPKYFRKTEILHDMITRFMISEIDTCNKIFEDFRNTSYLRPLFIINKDIKKDKKAVNVYSFASNCRKTVSTDKHFVFLQNLDIKDSRRF